MDEIKSHHKIYASFLQTYILKLENIIATQQSWYQPILEKLKAKQEEQQKLWAIQIQNSKNYKRNQQNADDRRSSNTMTMSVFNGDNIFGGNIMDNVMDEDDEEKDTKSPRNKLQLNDNRSNSMRAFKPRHSTSISMSNSHNHAFAMDMGMTDEDGMNNSLSFIAMKNKENAEEYAKQLTLLDWESFVTIDPRTCLYKILRKKQTDKWLAVKLFIDRFQQTHQYVKVSIVAAPDLKARIEMIEFFIFVAETLLKLNNLYSFMAVTTAVDSVSVSKLKIAWDFVNKSTMKKFTEQLRPLCSVANNYKKLRDHCKSMKPPGIPFLGLLLKDLTFTNDGNQNKLSKKLDRHINFQKYVLFYRILSANITNFHSATYSQNLQHSKQWATQDINSIIQQLNIYEDPEETKYDDDGLVFTEDDDINLSPRVGAMDSGNVTTPEVGPMSYNIRIDSIDAVDSDGNTDKYESKQEESKSKSYETMDQNIYGGHNHMHMRMNIIADEEFQSEILKDLNSYILLNKSVIRAMTMEANRLDLLKKDEYMSDYLRPKLTQSNSNQSKKGKSKNKSYSPKRSHVKSSSESGIGGSGKKRVSFKGGFKKLFLGATNSNTSPKNKPLEILKE